MVNRLRYLSIKGKFTVIILMVSVLLVGLIGTILIVSERMRLRDNLGGDLLTLAAIVGHNSGVGLVFDDTQATEEVLRSLTAKPNIMLAYVFDIKGKIFSTYQRKNISTTIHKTTLSPQDHDVQGFVFLNNKQELEIKDGLSFHEKTTLETEHLIAIKPIFVGDRIVGGIFVQSDLSELEQRLYAYIGTTLGIMVLSLVLANLLGARLQKIITVPIYGLRNTVQEVSATKNYHLRATKTAHDEIGELIEGFNNMLHRIEARDQEIRLLNEQLKLDNQRMSTELDITRRLQQMVLPTSAELTQIPSLDIAAYMMPADEVGGDYYDVLVHDNGIKIGIGDVTGHGLESGVVMLMVQMAVRTLLNHGVHDPQIFLSVLNSALFGNIQRMNTDKNLTLSLIDYQLDGTLTCVGQHEELIIARHDGQLERMDTTELGFMVGLLPDISRFLSHRKIHLEVGDGIVLYTDGVTEAHSIDSELYGIDRLCESIQKHWQLSAEQIKDNVIADLQAFSIGYKAIDDVTLLVIKKTHQP
jgi:serine phosphatase RsbU (regulator of sigma subunit)